MKVTALKRNSRAPDYLTVEIDGARFASLPEEVVARLELKAGRELTPEQFSALEFADDTERSYQRALRMLRARPRAVNDLMRRLRQKGHNPSAVAKAVGRLEDSGLLDDEHYAEHYVRVKAPQGFGRARLLSDLLSHGVDGRLAERCIDRVMGEEIEDREGMIRELILKRLRVARDVPKAAARRRIMGYLSRRGYSTHEYFDILDDALNDRRTER